MRTGEDPFSWLRMTHEQQGTPIGNCIWREGDSNQINIAMRGSSKKTREELAMAAQINQEECTGCGLCIDVCPVEAISLKDDKAKVDQETCVDCGQCVGECPNKAIVVP